MRQLTARDIAEMMPVDMRSYLAGDRKLIRIGSMAPRWVSRWGGAITQSCQIFRRGCGRHSATHCSVLAHGIHSTAYDI